MKTDKIDAATLAQLLAADFLPEVWIPDPETRSRRAQVAHRAGLVQQRSRLRNRVEAVLHRNLLECPWTDTFGKRGCQWLAHLNLPSADREQLDHAPPPAGLHGGGGRPSGPADCRDNAG